MRIRRGGGVSIYTRTRRRAIVWALAGIAAAPIGLCATVVVLMVLFAIGGPISCEKPPQLPDGYRIIPDTADKFVHFAYPTADGRNVAAPPQLIEVGCVGSLIFGIREGETGRVGFLLETQGNGVLEDDVYVEVSEAQLAAEVANRLGVDQSKVRLVSVGLYKRNNDGGPNEPNTPRR